MKKKIFALFLAMMLIFASVAVLASCGDDPADTTAATTTAPNPSSTTVPSATATPAPASTVDPSGYTDYIDGPAV